MSYSYSKIWLKNTFCGKNSQRILIDFKNIFFLGKLNIWFGIFYIDVTFIVFFFFVFWIVKPKGICFCIPHHRNILQSHDPHYLLFIYEPLVVLSKIPKICAMETIVLNIFKAKAFSAVYRWFTYIKTRKCRFYEYRFFIHESQSFFWWFMFLIVISIIDYFMIYKVLVVFVMN